MNTRALHAFPAVAALAACLLLVPGNLVAADAPAGNATSAKPALRYDDVAPALAKAVKEKTAFLAEVQPRLWAAGYRREAGYSRSDQSRTAAELLWRLRSDPEMQKAQEAILTAPVVLKQDDGRRSYRRDEDYEKRQVRNERIRTLERLLERADYIARAIQEKDPGDDKAHTPEEKSRRRRDLYDAPPAERIQETLQRNAGFERYMAFVLSVMRRAGVPGDDRGSWERLDRDAVPVLWQLRDRPADMETAFVMLKDKLLRGDERASLLQKLIKDPAKAKDEFSRLAETREIKRNYVYIMDAASAYEVISLPLSTLSAPAAQAIEKAGSVPLAATPVASAAPGLAQRRMTELLPRDVRDALQKKKTRSHRDDEERDTPNDATEALPFLKPGERLYTVIDRGARGHTAFPIVEGTPLADLGEFGPQLVEYTPQNVYLFGRLLAAAADNPGSSWYSRPVLLAAACPPQELAAHLSSLLVMKAERERSLFGSVESFVAKSKRNANSGGRSSGAPQRVYPQDAPGALLRLVKVTDHIVFTGLAPQADAAGLARLMGPIRAVWAYEGPSLDTPWQELRYTPPAPEKAVFAPLGKAPALSLDKPALESIVEKERAFITLAVTQSLSDQECLRQKLPKDSAECAGVWAGVFGRTQTLMKELAGKGFTDPADAGTVAYLLDYVKDDAAVSAKLRAMIDDTAKPAAERVEAMRHMAMQMDQKPRSTPKE